MSNRVKIKKLKLRKSSVRILILLILSGFVAMANLNWFSAPASLPRQKEVAAGPLLFEETFEKPAVLANVHSKDFSTKHAFTVVSEPVFAGNKSGKFELRIEDPLINNGKRVETTIINGSAGSKNRWYAFAAYFPAQDFLKDSQQEVISQWHQSADKHLGEKAQSPATALRIKNDRFYLDTGYNEQQVSDGVHPESRQKLDIGPVQKNVWHEFVIHIVHSYNNDGLIEVWHNGRKVITHKGGNMYNSLHMPKWKLGVYKASFKHNTSNVSRRVVYFDNIKVGNELATFADVSPASALVSD